MLVDQKLVGRCGLYCGSCLIYRAYKDSEKLRQRIADEEKCSPEDIKCEGCQTVLTDGWNSKEWGRNCRIVACLEDKNLGFCYECDTYPECNKFRKIADGLLKRGVDLKANLSKIQAGRAEKWLEEERQRWKCRKCGNPTSAYIDECHWCGAKQKMS